MEEVLSKTWILVNYWRNGFFTDEELLEKLKELKAEAMSDVLQR